MLRKLFPLVLFLPVLAIAEPNSSFKVFAPKGMDGTWQSYVTGGGASRCEVQHCICKVHPDKRLPAGTPTNDPDRRLSIQFSRDSHSVDSGSRNKISEFKSFFPNAVFTVIGYTDGCGNLAHNSSLAEKRAKAVKRILGSSTNPIFKPEITSKCDPAARRVDVVAHTKNRMTTILDKIPADVYLIDASGSMWSQWRNWSDVISASFNPGSRIYLSKTVACRDGQKISEVAPSGGTEIWYSYWKVLDYMKEGETLLIISDFKSDIPLTQRESITIENKVAAKKVKVFVVQL